MKKSDISSFYVHKPLFGLDIGHGSLKVMQVSREADKEVAGAKPKVMGYGVIDFDKEALYDGVIVKPEVIAKAIKELFKSHLIGEINTRRVTIAVPTYRTFTRALQLPKLNPTQLREAVELEVEQYISVPLEDLYLDYQVVQQGADFTRLFVVAVPKDIVDSYLDLARISGLEPVMIEPTLSASGRIFSLDHQSDVATVIIDFGSLSSDISIFDKQMLVAGTVQGGGENFTESIKNKLHVTFYEAGQIKTRYGLSVSKQQSEIREALEPILQQIVKEIRRMVRYYEERYGTDRPIKQLVVLGGGANIPGLSDYLTSNLRLAVRLIDLWHYLDYEGLEPPLDFDKPMYATVAGLSLVIPKEVV